MVFNTGFLILYKNQELEAVSNGVLHLVHELSFALSSSFVSGVHCRSYPFVGF
jgi:hypothetical protein